MKASFSKCRQAAIAAAFSVSTIGVHAADKGAAKASSPSPSPKKSVASAKASPPAQPPLELKDPVAIVNGEKITKAQLEKSFDDQLKATGIPASSIPNAQKLGAYRQILDNLIVEKLIRAKAANIEVTDQDVKNEIEKIKKQFPNEEQFKQQLKAAGQTEQSLTDLVREGLRQRKWIDSQIAGKDKVDDAEAKKFYDENPKEFERPETVQASHILFMVPDKASDKVVKEKEQAAEAALKRAKKGEDFGKLAKELSEEPGAKETGGDLGFFSKDDMVPEFGDAVFKAKQGDIIGPIRTQFGFHIIKVGEKKPAGKVSFDEAKPQIAGFLEATKKREAVRDVIKQLRDSAKVEIFLPEPPKPPAPAPSAATSASPTASASSAASATPAASAAATATSTPAAKASH